MKKTMKLALALVATAILLPSCGCYTKMMKDASTAMTVTCDPELVTLKGDSAITSVTIDVPAKLFHQSALLKITPVIVTESGEVAGTPVFFQGEDVEDNYKAVAYGTASQITIDVAIPYSADMRMSELVFRAEAKCLKSGNKIKEFTQLPEDIFVTNGVSTLQLMADNYAQVAIAPDAFQRTTYINEEAKIMFTIGSPVVRSAQLNSEEIEALEKFIIENSGDPKKTVGDVYTQAYASPDGPLKLNDKLSENRGTNTHKAVERKFKKGDVPADTKFDVNAMGEDWEGFKELVEKSDIKDKNLILQVLSMYSDPQVRDREITNMTAAFDVLAEKILPELRRSKMTVNVKVDGLTDDELKAAVASDINTLDVEEMLFAATLYTDNETKATIYKAAADKFNDFRAWNNLGVVMAKMGKYDDAKANFMKAAAIDNTNPQVVNNLGVVALAEGKKDEAAKYFASSNTPEAKYNKGLVELAKGNYAAAIGSLSGFNKGLAQLLNDDIEGAKATLENETCWKSDYIKAVIAGKEGNGAELIKLVESAVDKGGVEVAELAATEVNFLEYLENVEFIAVLN